LRERGMWSGLGDGCFLACHGAQILRFRAFLSSSFGHAGFSVKE
jgi:hypothetical protein